jgi:hypothetical protein
MSALSYQVPEPLVETRVRVYVDGLDAPRHQLRSPPVCEGRSILLEGTPWLQCIAALRSRSVRGPFPISNAITLQVKQRTLSMPRTVTTWLVDITVADGAAHALVYSTLPRLDVGPIAVRPTDDVVAVAIKVLEASASRR